MFLSDENMLKAINILKESGEISFFKVAYDVIGWDKQRISKVKNQDKLDRSYHFSAEDIRVFCDYFNIDPNYIFGFSSNFYRNRAQNNKIER